MRRKYDKMVSQQTMGSTRFLTKETKMQAKQKGDSQTPRKTPITGPTWKMPKPVKALLTTFVDPHERGHYKRMMMDAWATQQRHALESAKKKGKSED